jgi:hypothetical protein
MHADPIATAVEDAIRMVQDWSERKGRLITDAHIRLAWTRLAQQNWLAATDELAGTAAGRPTGDGGGLHAIGRRWDSATRGYSLHSVRRASEWQVGAP